MNSKRIGKIGEVVVEVKSTPTPWAEGFGDGVVVLATGLHGSTRGTLASYWRSMLEGGRQALRQIDGHIRHTLWVEPGRPAWMVMPLNVGGKTKNCTICVATAIDRNGPHPDNAKRAISAIAGEAERRGIRRLSAPLLGAGTGGLDPSVVAQRELEAIAARYSDQSGGLRAFTLLVREEDFTSTVKAAAEFLSSTHGADNWYKAIEEQGRFQRIHVLEKLPGGYSGARLDVCEVIRENGSRMPLTVFKIGPREMIQEEARRARQAHDLLGEYAVEVADTYVLDGRFDALRMPLATRDYTGNPAMSYLRFFEASGDPHEVAQPLTVLFGSATRALYENATVTWATLSELREVMERTRSNRYWVEAEQGFARLLLSTNALHQRDGVRVTLGYPVNAPIDDPFHKETPLARSWDVRVQVPIARTTHGDLNPRNVVVIWKDQERSFVPRILDFHRFGESGPLDMDFARFEVGLHIKCLEGAIRSQDPEAAARLLRYAAFMIENFVLPVDKSLVGSVAPEFTKAVFAVASIRKRYVALSPIEEERRSYWMCLSLCLLSYLRPIYDARLSDGQRSFASFMAASILERHVVPAS